MAELKTKLTKVNPARYIGSIKDPQKRKDAALLMKLFKTVTKKKPRMWGDWPLTAFSARVQNLTLYVMPGFKDLKPLLKKLGPHKTSVGCLYIKRLDKVDPPVLTAIIKQSYREMKKRYAKTVVK